ncbi:hypothetical protein CAEBREN_13927 [Caenorhabditis brenneri]|uniref:Ubiquitin-like domain-containing protein n=1 Tax=Caenorhabditis brenneri TaxID=135651 RepID=G0MMV7_CAEBE|nr:hypothetical protein CAEBREN_13927 [Caenorhabditis brenneri]
MGSQQSHTERVIRRVEEEARVLRALATENESNKILIKDLQGQLKEEKEREKRQNQVMEEMRKEITLLRNGEEDSKSINITVNPLGGEQIPLRMRSSDTTYALKLKIQELTRYPPSEQRLVFQRRLLEDDKSLADSGIVCGSTVYMTLRLGGPGRLQSQLNEAKEREERQNQVIEELKQEIALLRDGEESSDIINITVKTLMGKQFTFKMRSHDVVFMMKLRMKELENLPVDMQRWVFENRELRDDKTLADSGIVSGSTVYMSLRLGGPGRGSTSE